LHKFFVFLLRPPFLPIDVSVLFSFAAITCWHFSKKREQTEARGTTTRKKKREEKKQTIPWRAAC